MRCLYKLWWPTETPALWNSAAAVPWFVWQPVAPGMYKKQKKITISIISNEFNVCVPGVFTCVSWSTEVCSRAAALWASFRSLWSVPSSCSICSTWDWASSTDNCSCTGETSVTAHRLKHPPGWSVYDHFNIMEKKYGVEFTSSTLCCCSVNCWDWDWFIFSKDCWYSLCFLVSSDW